MTAAKKGVENDVAQVYSTDSDCEERSSGQFSRFVHNMDCKSIRLQLLSGKQLCLTCKGRT